MISQGVVRQRLYIYCFGLHIISNFLTGCATSTGQIIGTNINADQRSESEKASIHPTNEIVEPTHVRNRRDSLFSGNGHLYGSNEGLNSAFLYNDQIMQNLFSSPSSKPMSYARSNFFLNYLKPRATRYNAWDDHSLMHFGKRSLENDIDTEKVLIKRSTDFWSPNNVLHFGKKSENLDEDSQSPQNSPDTEIDKSDSDINAKEKASVTSDSVTENGYASNIKKSGDPWHSMMSFGKKSQNPWDHTTLHFGKKDDLYSEVNSDKRSENFWDHNTMHFGKRNDPWHNMMSFGKKSDPWHNMMSFGKKSDPWHNMMSFGKKSDPWHSMMSFGKKSDPWHSMMSFGKRSDPWHNMMSFGKKSDNFWDHNTLHFGKKDEPWHNIMSFGKRFENAWDHNTLHFGKRDEWDHNTLHFGKRDPFDHNTLHFGKRNDPWHSMMSFGKRSDNLWDHNTLHFGKKDDPWHNMMSFGKKSENSDMTDLEKREDPWHNMMSFGKKSDGLLNNKSMTEKRDEPWHNMMSFGKKSDYGFDHNTMHFGKREEPWHSMMSFGKKSGNPWDHNTLHFGKRDEPWHSMMSFGKKSGNPWDPNTLHFGKRDEPWHSMMSFGKKLDPLAETRYSPLERENYLSSVMFEKKSHGPMDDLSEDISRNTDPWQEYDNMMFFKKNNPWDHNTLHFGKKSNETWDFQSIEKEKENRIRKRSTDMWNSHHTMHFGKKFDPWDNHNTMHFGKKSEPLEKPNKNDFEINEEDNDISKLRNVDKKFDWDSHNTMHFGKRDPEDYRNSFLFEKRDPWDYHNTMHFGKREPWDNQNTMHFGKRDPWDYHNTLHFGKRDSWDYHNTMHFGKRNPWDYHNTMHFGKRSNFDSTDAAISLTDKTEDVKILSEDSNKDSSNGNLDNKANNKVSSLSKRSPIDPKLQSFSEKPMKDKFNQKFSNSKFHSLSKVTTIPQENIKLTDEAVNKENNVKSSVIQNSSTKDQSHSPKKSRIQKRSIKSNSFMKNSNDDSSVNEDLSQKYSKDDISDSVLHFGKRSVLVPENYEEEGFDSENDKRFDDFWNDHNTLHFGKKSDFPDILPFEKKSDEQDLYGLMSNMKRDPWEHLNTLHFGKRFDPWDGHDKMHFGKRADAWDHNVMHFGKRDELTSDELEFLSSLDDSDLSKIREYVQSQTADGRNNAEYNDFLENLVILKSIINSHLKDDSISFEDRVNLLRHYLKPILKEIIEAEEPNIITLFEPNDIVNRRFKNMEEIQEQPSIAPLKLMNGVKYDEAIFKDGNDDSSYGEYGDNSKRPNDSNESENLVKSKRKYFGKAELKRYFVPFQGPKSIVYPHAWFASQIRRSSLPRTDYSRHMEMRMAEKKEDPFNSYMHFGRR